MDFPLNAVLVQGATLADIEAIVDRAVEKRMEAFYERIRERPRELVRRKDAARMLGVSLPTIQSYSKSGLLHPVHVGGRVMFYKDELDSYKSR